MQVMKKILHILSGRTSAWMEICAGVALMAVMLLIGTDIIGRVFGHPVPGTYEIVSLAGGFVLGMALPATSAAKEHVSTDFLSATLSPQANRLLAVITRLIGILIFVLAGYGMVRMGMRLKEAGEVTAVLAFPIYYVMYAIGGAFFIQVFVLASELVGPPDLSENKYE